MRIEILRQVRVALIAAMMFFIVEGCVFGGKSAGVKVSDEGRHQKVNFSSEKLTVDAYLFDVKFKDNGKRRSVRLDVFFADSLALFTARGYLGKGVAKGVWRPDSSLFYFPTAKEYFSGALDEMTRAGCAAGGDLQRLVPTILSGRFLYAASGDSAFEIIKHTEKELQVNLTLGTCETPVVLIFDHKGDSPFWGAEFYLKEFRYEPADGNGKVVGKRRVLKRGKTLESRKFVIDIPDDAGRVQW